MPKSKDRKKNQSTLSVSRITLRDRVWVYLCLIYRVNYRVIYNIPNVKKYIGMLFNNCINNTVQQSRSELTRVKYDV